MQTDAPPRVVSLAAEDGEAIWTVGLLAIRKLSGEQTDGALELAKFVFRGGYSPPWHLHHHTAECFYVLSGEIRFECGDVVERHGPGGFVHLPAGVPHSFYVESEEGARVLHTGSPVGLWDFHAAAGQPAPALTVPPEAPFDVAALSALAAEHGIEILGPPLGA